MCCFVILFWPESGRDNHLENWCQKFPWQKKSVPVYSYRTVCAVVPPAGLNTLQHFSVTTFVADIGEERFTFGFTVRDSPDFFINVTAWGNDAYVNGLSSTFSIGHCGEEVIS